MSAVITLPRKKARTLAEDYCARRREWKNCWLRIDLAGARLAELLPTMVEETVSDLALLELGGR